MYSLDYPIGINLLKDELLLIPVVPLIKSAKSRSDFIERLINAEKLYDKDVIIIDKISELVKYSIDPEKSIELISFFKKISGMGKVVVFTIDPGDLDPDISAMFRSSADIYMSLKSRIVAGEVKRSINVNKFTGATGFVGGVIGFRIEPGAGLIIEIASVA